MIIALIVFVVVVVGLAVAICRAGTAPAFYRGHSKLPGAILIERVRDQRADISAALRRS